jgi:hypothetical protein
LDRQADRTLADTAFRRRAVHPPALPQAFQAMRSLSSTLSFGVRRFFSPSHTSCIGCLMLLNKSSIYSKIFRQFFFVSKTGSITFIFSTFFFLNKFSSDIGLVQQPGWLSHKSRGFGVFFEKIRQIRQFFSGSCSIIEVIEQLYYTIIRKIARLLSLENFMRSKTIEIYTASFSLHPGHFLFLFKN